MNRFSVLGTLSLALLALGATACTADATGSTGESSQAATAAPDHEGTVIASLQLAEGRTVTFRQFSSGELAVIEDGNVKLKPILPTVHGSILDVYRALSNGAAPPDALVSAEAARTSAAPAAAVAPPPAATKGLTAENVRGFHPMITGTDTWFQETFCTDLSSNCLFGNNQELVTSWNATNDIGQDSYTQNMTMVAMNVGTVASTYGVNRWNGSAWITLYTATMAVDHYNGMYSWTPGFSYFQAWETATGGDTGIEITPLSPRFDDATYYTNGNLVFNGEQFVNDTSVTVTLTVGTATETVGTYSVTSPSSTQPGIFGGSSFIYCSPYSSPGSYNGTLKATGVQSTQTATTTVQLTACEP